MLNQQMRIVLCTWIDLGTIPGVSKGPGITSGGETNYISYNSWDKHWYGRRARILQHELTYKTNHVSGVWILILVLDDNYT